MANNEFELLMTLFQTEHLKYFTDGEAQRHCAQDVIFVMNILTGNLFQLPGLVHEPVLMIPPMIEFSPFCFLLIQTFRMSTVY